MYEELLALPNVVGAGLGIKNRQVSVTVLVSKKLPVSALRNSEIVPMLHALGSERYPIYRTDVIQVGEIVAQQVDPKLRHRPAFPGCSIGHYKVSAGTLGAVVRDKDTKYMRILSNNHIMANSNDAANGDGIYQPGTYDGGKAIDLIALLDRWVPINMTVDLPTCSTAKGVATAINILARLARSSHRLKAIKTQALTNKVDAAIAMPVEESQIDPEIANIGKVAGTRAPLLGMLVQKMGRTTGYTEGDIRVVGATVNVNYGEGRMALFENQFITGPMSAPGDSGSLILDMDNNAVGLLFAGSEQVTIYNPIYAVLAALNIEMWI